MLFSLYANMLHFNVCSSVWANRNTKSVRHEFQSKKYSLYMSQQYSYRKSAKYYQSKKYCSIKPPPHPQRVVKENPCWFFLLNFTKQYFQCLCPSYHKVSEMNNLQRELELCYRKPPGFFKFSVIGEQTQTQCWFWQGQSGVKKNVSVLRGGMIQAEP